uniref:Uncharacterized protein n=1 Tax=Arundo donax TaxID=35708 RepID=A0A0A8YQW8_ARUDO
MRVGTICMCRSIKCSGTGWWHNFLVCRGLIWAK